MMTIGHSGTKMELHRFILAKFTFSNKTVSVIDFDIHIEVYDRHSFKTHKFHHVKEVIDRLFQFTLSYESEHTIKSFDVSLIFQFTLPYRK